MKKQPVLLIGGGGHCHSVIDVVEQQSIFQIYGLVDVPEKLGRKVLGYPVIGTDDDLPELVKNCLNAVITVGHIKSNALRVKLYETARDLGFNLPVIISPLAYVSKHAKLGAGTVVMHHALINANAYIGQNCIINSKALVEHDATIGNHCHMATAAVVNGGVDIDDNTFVGSNAMTKENIQIGKNCLVGGGESFEKPGQGNHFTGFLVICCHLKSLSFERR